MKRAIMVTTCLLAVLLSLSGCSSNTPPSTPPDPSGTWSGEWGPSPDRQTEVTVELKWDGTTLKGTINPGYNAIELAKASFDPKTGAIRMELDGPNSKREIVRYVIEGKVEGSTMSGTFDRAGETGTFKIEKK
jgi:predicted small lipoprotein YifL